MEKDKAILLIECPDAKGIIRAITDFLFENSGNIVYLEEHVDSLDQQFFMRIEWEIDQFQIEHGKIGEYFDTLIGRKFAMNWQLHFSNYTPRAAIFVSKLSHCLYDILYRYQSGEWKVEIPLIIGNHEKLKSIADQFGIPFHHFHMSRENKASQEIRQVQLLKEHHIDLVVLARYMQIVTGDFIRHFPYRIINIHHSFLPAFIGAKPYHAAHDRGVKIIGATAHYVTEELDAGPIISQDVAHVTHKDSVRDMVRRGKDVEKIVLSRAITKHLEHKVLTYKNRTVVFD